MATVLDGQMYNQYRLFTKWHNNKWWISYRLVEKVRQSIKDKRGGKLKRGVLVQKGPSLSNLFHAQLS